MAEGRGAATLPRLFAEQVARTPDAVAIVCGDQRLTYEDLDRRAGGLAAELRRMGVGPEVPVGVCLDRSEWSIVAFLGVVKAGGVYVPLDPEYPAERLAHMMSQARMALVLTSESAGANLPAGQEVDRLLIDAAGTSSADGAGVPDPGVVPANLACMFYTSGSTGAPKCVMLTHANIANYFSFWRRTYLAQRPMRAHTQMTSVAFVIFVADVTRTLLSGATLVVCPREVVLSPADLYELMVREGVNSAEFVPPVLELLLEYLEDEGLSLRFLDLLVAGGDIWYARDYLRARKICGDATLMVSAYGMTETSIDNATYPDGVLDGPEGIVPIGRPALNTALRVLDGRFRPVPPGVMGELYIGGAGVARGYHRRPALTAERFVPDPWDAAGGRLYRSGDLARHRADGVHEIAGRADDQVKVNGFRIEPGEVEAVLRSHAEVEKAVVSVRGDTSGDTCLAAHVRLARPGDDGRLADIQDFVAERLPPHMVPAVISELADIPLNAHGKVDRRALAATFAKPIGPGDGRAEEVPMDAETAVVYRVVVNHEEQYSIWPAARENPPGWSDAGKTGTKDECLAYIDDVWTDMRPLSLRTWMAEQDPAEHGGPA